MIYFGESFCRATDEGEQIPAPVGENCAWCNEEIVGGIDSGIVMPYHSLSESERELVYYHADCFKRTIFGSLGHIRKQCSCFGGTLEDPPELSLREAASAAVREFESSSRSRDE